MIADRKVGESWVELFEANEKAWEAGDVGRIRTDEQIHHAMRVWFPDRDSPYFYDIKRVRQRENRAVQFIRYYEYERDQQGRVRRKHPCGLPCTDWKLPPTATRKRNRVEETPKARVARLRKGRTKRPRA